MTKRAPFMPVLLLISFCLIAQSSYVSKNALEMAHLSQIAYQAQAAIDGWTCNPCKSVKITNQKSFFSSGANIQGFAGYLPDLSVILLSFRGSVDTKNWIANLNTVSTTYAGCAGCHVHAGFYGAYKGVSPLVHSAIQNLQAAHRGASIVITGHSLGGAMAILAALDLHEMKAPIKFVYTFGQPRVGDAAFSSHYAGSIPETYRVVNYADIVPHVPPSSFGFVHGGHEIWYHPRGMQTFDTCASEASTCANSINLVSYSTDDHNLSNYLKMKVSIQEEQKSIVIDDLSNPELLVDSEQAKEELKKVQEEILRIQEELNKNKKNIFVKYLRKE